MKKKLLSAFMADSLIMASLAGCSSGSGGNTGGDTGTGTGTDTVGTTDTAKTDADTGAADTANMTETQKIIAEAQTMTLEELAAKAIEESNGATFYGVGNSSRGKTGLPLFIFRYFAQIKLNQSYLALRQ